MIEAIKAFNKDAKVIILIGRTKIKESEVPKK